MIFFAGQRWLSDTETDLGLGTVLEVNQRQVTLLFPAANETRVYASSSAPLTRLQLEPGDSVKSHEGWLLDITDVSEHQGQLTYHGIREDNGETVSLREIFVDHQMQLNKPQQRLMNGLFDHPKWFDLRHDCLEHQYQHQTSELLGFVGARVDFIPHQLHIAKQVGQRFAPRVLLADEVGLGKTIEAALIIHQQLLSGRASRVLIVVPSSLVHQWLVEMLRRVNLAFAVFDQERCQAFKDEESETNTNPFETEQLVICSLDFLVEHPSYHQLAQQAHWDLLVVDEAHHLQWSAEGASPEYTAIEALAQSIKGVLLLTATPDQLGHQSHFARLRLLDPDRFYDYQEFVDEEAKYSQLADAIEPLLSDLPLNADQIKAITPYTAGDSNIDLTQLSGDNSKLINHLLDCHGTGRLLFRNSRQGVQGFPTRWLKTYSLPYPTQYQQLSSQQSFDLQICPDRAPELSEIWTRFDPRVNWFIRHLTELQESKVLTICKSAATALALAEVLRVREGKRAAVFHEGMSIIERDKAASYFAQKEEGAQVLICSEIGSEGRNFQFAQHLVLFDLPQVPDLLEQRIGRLDRIGQKQDVIIHVPYFAQSAQSVLLDWYHQGLDAFEHTCPTGNAAFEILKDDLHHACLDAQNSALHDALIQKTQNLHQELKLKLEQGRDKLLELNSSGKGKIDDFVEQLLVSDDSPTLERFMTRLFDTVGVAQEDHDENSYLLRPTESLVNNLPGLDEDGMTITYERQAALQFEHLHFFSWDHPMVQHAMDMILTDVHGKSSIALTHDEDLPVGYYWIECLFVLSAKAPKHLQLSRFLPATPIRLCLNAANKEDDPIFFSLNKVSFKMAKQLISALSVKIDDALERIEQIAEQRADIIRQQSSQHMQQLLSEEKQRLLTLQQVNPAIRDDEIQHLELQLSELKDAIGNAKLEFESVRLVVNTH
ncbi:RNA polymerase-associated protein RapA [Alteromonadaceae bacterium BrNp21-10]|nr:RNA polymerase-associated protein RapA [Alteromonadaceae bacterium BrNp21-10]